MPPLNILYLHSHDTGRWISPYGHPVPTPCLDRFARQGALFRDAHCAGPTCSPSRAALLTGLAPHSAGMLGLAHRGFAWPDYRLHLCHHLRSLGYATALAGIQHVVAEQRLAETGYTHNLRGADQGADTVSRQAAAFLAGHPPEPFFLDAGVFETHRRFPEPDPTIDPRYLAMPAPVPDTPATRADYAGFLTSVRSMDAGYARILAALEASGLAARTLVLITTDHGPAFPGMKCRLTSQGTGVLLLLRGPGVPAGLVSDALVSHLDVLPTLCDLAGIPIPAGRQGATLRPLLDGRAGAVREEAVAEVSFHAAYEPQRMVRTKDWCYIRRFDGRAREVLPNVDESPSKDAWLAGGDAARLDPAADLLYDLRRDPWESTSRAADPACAMALADMRARLHRWMAATADPLLAGAIPLPAGAFTNPVDDRAPAPPPGMAHPHPDGTVPPAPGRPGHGSTP